MKYARFEYKDTTRFGIIEEDVVKEISGSIFEEFKKTGEAFLLKDVKLLAPCHPTKIIAVGLNYIDHIKELGHEMPTNPVLFIKLPHTVTGPESAIVIPPNATRVDYEAELAVVIKKECRNVSTGDARKYILGATCLNDVTERDMQKADGQWTRAKNFETFCPIGPWIVSDIDYNNLEIELLLNGETKQKSNTKNLLWSVDALLSYVSGIMPLYPGDILTTGTPFGVSPMKEGDRVEVVIEGIGTLKNDVKGA
ncbi:MAG: fumarylacetoacetate hydrolase family protein [Clostridia bacterium]|nr:fumarylacetoacetate hydrolase family protein [Clostridia bacterium]